MEYPASRLHRLETCIGTWYDLVTRLLLLAPEERQERHSSHLHHLSSNKPSPVRSRPAIQRTKDAIVEVEDQGRTSATDKNNGSLAGEHHAATILAFNLHLHRRSTRFLNVPVSAKEQFPPSLKWSACNAAQHCPKSWVSWATGAGSLAQIA